MKMAGKEITYLPMGEMLIGTKSIRFSFEFRNGILDSYSFDGTYKLSEDGWFRDDESEADGVVVEVPLAGIKVTTCLDGVHVLPFTKIGTINFLYNGDQDIQKLDLTVYNYYEEEVFSCLMEDVAKEVPDDPYSNVNHAFGFPYYEDGRF